MSTSKTPSSEAQHDEDDPAIADESMRWSMMRIGRISNSIILATLALIGSSVSGHDHRTSTVEHPAFQPPFVDVHAEDDEVVIFSRKNNPPKLSMEDSGIFAREKRVLRSLRKSEQEEVLKKSLLID
jgi:hypothetical protein